MKILLVDAKARIDLNCIEKNLDRIPQGCGIVTTLQHRHALQDIAAMLKKHGKDCIILGQVLGCNQDVALGEEAAKAGSFLYIGTGRFHPIGIAAKTDRPVHCIDPYTGIFSEVKPEEIDRFTKKKKAAATLFLAKERIGLIISLKTGQRYEKASEIEKRIKERYPEKETFLFACGTLDFNELENFPFIDLWINTMCPRIGYDDSIRMLKPIVNIEDIKNLIL